MEECTTTTTNTHPLETPPEDQGVKSIESAGFLLEPVRSITLTGQTGLTRNQKKKSKKYSRRRSRQAQASEMSASSSDVDNKCLIAKIKEMAKEDKFQVRVIKALTQELEMIKQEQDSLAQRYHKLSNDYANVTNSSICVASLEKENQMLKVQVEKLTSEHVTLQGTHLELEKSYEMLVD